MNKKNVIFITCMILLVIQGCNCKAVDQDKSDSTISNVSEDLEYNLEVTNNTPLLMKSIVVKVSNSNEKKADNKEIEALMDSYIKTGGTGKFHVSEQGKYNLKITLNPEDNYSVSDEFVEEFDDKSVLTYEVVIEENEIKIQRVENRMKINNYWGHK